MEVSLSILLSKTKKVMKISLSDQMKRNEYFRFFYKILIFLLIVFILDFTVGSLLKYYYFKQKHGPLYTTTYAIEKTTADVIILGSSKAKHQYNPKIFAERLNRTCYNAGSGGSSIFYNYAILKSIIKRYYPKIIILDITREFVRNQSSYDRIAEILPYYDRHPEMRSTILLKSPYEKIKLISKIYPYNSLLFSIILGNIEYNSKFARDQEKEVNGFLPLTRIWSEPIKIDSIPANYELDSTKIKLFEIIIKDCIQNNVKLYVVQSPDFAIKKYIEKSNLAGQEIAQKYKVKFLDYYQDSLFLNHGEYFSDISHLNGKGADVFSNIIVGEIIKDQNSSKILIKK